MKKSLFSLLLLAVVMVSASAQKPVQTLQKEGTETKQEKMKTNSPEQQANMQTERLTKMLSLAPDQVKQVYQACLTAATKIEKLKAIKVNKPEQKKAAMAQINTERDDTIRKILKPEQVEKFDQVMGASSVKGAESKATRKVDFLDKNVKLTDEQKKMAFQTFTKYETLRAKVIKDKPTDGTSVGAAIQELREAERQEIKTFLNKEQIAIFNKTKGNDRPTERPRVERPDRSKTTPVKPEKPKTTPVKPEKPKTTPVKPEKPKTTPVKPEKPKTTPVKPEKPTSVKPKISAKVQAQQYTEVLTEKLDLTELQAIKIQTLNNNAAEEIENIQNGRANETTKMEMIKKIISERDAAIAKILNRKQKKAFDTVKSGIEMNQENKKSNRR